MVCTRVLTPVAKSWMDLESSKLGILTFILHFSSGSHGASKNVQLIDFPVVDQAVDFLRNDCHCQSIVGLMGPLPDGFDSAGYPVLEDAASNTTICGSVDEDPTSSRRSFPLHAFSFPKEGNICFAVCKLRQGLPGLLARWCDSFVHIPHVTIHTNRPLLDTPACLVILLHEYTAAAGYGERTFEGHKFEVIRPQRCLADSTTSRTDAQARDERRAAVSAEEEDALARDMGDLFASSADENGSDGDY